jgi:hypothetical protein
LRVALAARGRLGELSHETFIAAWGAIAFIAPGLHPDDSSEPQGGWPEGWRSIANEAFRRSELGHLKDGELYPYHCSQHSLGIVV